jgi:hypothetical protein
MNTFTIIVAICASTLTGVLGVMLYRLKKNIHNSQHDIIKTYLTNELHETKNKLIKLEENQNATNELSKKLSLNDIPTLLSTRIEYLKSEEIILEDDQAPLQHWCLTFRELNKVSDKQVAIHEQHVKEKTLYEKRLNSLNKFRDLFFQLKDELENAEQSNEDLTKSLKGLNEYPDPHLEKSKKEKALAV